MIEPNTSDETPEIEGEEAATDAGSGEAKEKKKELTPEEQMALYEESLKDDDWGHQPC